MLLENLKMAWSSLVNNKLRALLTMLGIIVGIGSVIAVVALGEGGKDAILAQFDEIGASSVMIAVQSSRASETDYITDDDIKAIQAIDGVRYTTSQMQLISQIRINQESGTLAMIVAIDPNYEQLNAFDILHGRRFTEIDFAEGRRVVVMEAASARDLFGREDVVDETVELTYRGKRLTARIVGVAKSSSSAYLSMMPGGSAEQVPAFVYLPLQSAAGLTDRVRRHSMLMVMVEDPALTDQVGQQALRLLERRHDNADREVYSRQNIADILDQVNSVFALITNFISAVAAISLLVGGIGVMNIMLVSVTERTREIGTRKALGATNGDILMQFITESIIMTLIGGLIGILFGLGLAMLIGRIANFSPRLSLTSVIIAVLFSSAVGLFFGIWPARKASRLHPIDALRYE